MIYTFWESVQMFLTPSRSSSVVKDTIGGNNKDIAWHTVLKVGNFYFDIRGKQDINQVMSHNPIALTKESIQPAGPNEVAHIIKLLNMNFVNETIEGLKKASKE